METPQQTSSRRRTPSDAELPALLAKIAESKQSVAGFARSHELSPWKLYKARRELGAKPVAPVGFEPVRIVVAPTTSTPIELHHASGHRLLVPTGFDSATLQSLLEVLEAC